MNTLFIDTSDNKSLTIRLEVGSEKDEVIKEIDRRKSQAVLEVIEALLKKHSLEFADLSAIDVVTGPGSFTGLRVGVAIANTLGLLLHIPINGQEVGKSVEPIYS